MSAKGARLVYYSPTGTSRKVAEAVAVGLGVAHGSLDLTRPNGGREAVIGHDELGVFAVPVYGGRVPVTAVNRLRAVKGEGGPAVLIAVYGNRAYEDALQELRDLAVGQGFRPVAAAAFIGEHSFSTASTPIAHGRPDVADLRKAAAFGADVKRKMEAPEQAPSISVPGNRPYKERRSASEGLHPETDRAACTLCGACARACPTGAIIVDESVKTAKGMCTRCTACVKACPTGARAWVNPEARKIAAWLHTECGERKEPETFL